MSLRRTFAILIQEFYITRKTLETIVDLFYFSIISILAFGLLFAFLEKAGGGLGARYLLLGLLLWEIIRVAQYSMSMGSLWNIWSRNLANMFVAPLSVREYFIANMISGFIKSLVSFSLVTIISIFIFRFNILNIGIGNLLLSYLNLLIFAWWVGIIILGLIFFIGTRIQALAWGLVFIFQPLTAVFYPLSILPLFLQKIAYLFPPTYVFENARNALVTPGINWQFFSIALSENLIYFALALLFFNFLFNKSKETGQFVNNET